MRLYRIEKWDGTPIRVTVTDGTENDGATLNAFAQMWKTAAITVAPGCWSINRLARKAMTTERLIGLAADMFECGPKEIQITETRERGETFVEFSQKD